MVEQKEQIQPVSFYHLHCCTKKHQEGYSLGKALDSRATLSGGKNRFSIVILQVSPPKNSAKKIKYTI
jgi:hypothetical protein